MRDFNKNYYVFRKLTEDVYHVRYLTSTGCGFHTHHYLLRLRAIYDDGEAVYAYQVDSWINPHGWTDALTVFTTDKKKAMKNTVKMFRVIG